MLSKVLFYAAIVSRDSCFQDLSEELFIMYKLTYFTMNETFEKASENATPIMYIIQVDSTCSHLNYIGVASSDVFVRLSCQVQ